MAIGGSAMHGWEWVGRSMRGRAMAIGRGRPMASGRGWARAIGRGWAIPQESVSGARETARALANGWRVARWNGGVAPPRRGTKPAWILACPPPGLGVELLPQEADARPSWVAVHASGGRPASSFGRGNEMRASVNQLVRHVR